MRELLFLYLTFDLTKKVKRTRKQSVATQIVMVFIAS